MTMDALPTAAAAGFHMPAEWEPHERCWMAWPCRLEVWGENLAATRQAYADVANTISEFEPVTMLALPQHAAGARRLCGDKVVILQADLDDSWTRDMGPNFVVNDAGEVAASVFQFNAWGKKYEPWRNDAAIGHRIAEYLGVRTFSAPIFMEGGGINVDGDGTLITSEQCVLHDNRNPGLTKENAVQVFCDALGVKKVLWVPGDPEDMETDGHIDGLACFVEPGKVLVEICPAEGTERFDNLQKNLDALRGETDAKGRELEVLVIEEAHEAERSNEIFCSSYINFYIANGGIVMPCFGIDRDEDARQNLAALFPDREVVQINIDDIAIGGGGIHCITQQQPARI
jgi:agmatine deiminase